MKILDIDPSCLNFGPNQYGPYSHTVNDERDSLEKIGYLKKKDGKYHLSKDSYTEVKKIVPPNEDVGFRMSVMSKFQSSLDFDELLLIIYYDDLTRNDGKYLQNSVIKNDIFKNRFNISKKLFEERKVSREKAAMLAGMDLFEFEKMLIKVSGKAYVD